MTFGASLGILFLLKIDTLLWIVLILAVAIITWCEFPVKPVALALLISLPWVVWSAVNFGSVIPHTVIAKQVAYHRLQPFSFDDLLAIPTPGKIQSNFALKLLFAVCMFGVLIGTAARAIRRRNWTFLAFPAYGIVYTLILVFSGIDLGLWVRWTTPTWVLLLIGVGYLAEGVFEWFSTLSSTRWVSVLLVLMAVTGHIVPISYESAKTPDANPFRMVNDWLCAHCRRDETIMLEPIGLIGFSTNLYVHDFIGLVSPQITEARKASGCSDSWYMEYVRARRPTYVILRTDELLNNTFTTGGYEGPIFCGGDSAWFSANYEAAFESAVGPRVDWLVVLRSRDDATRGATPALLRD